MTVTVSPLSPETFFAGGCIFTVLDDGASTAGRIGVVQLEIPPGWGGPPQHIHRQHDEMFFVLTGRVTFTNGAETILAERGRLITAPIGCPHTFANSDREAPAVLLCTVAPEKYIGYFRRLSRLAPGLSGPPDPKQVLTVMADYATDPYRPPDE